MEHNNFLLVKTLFICFFVHHASCKPLKTEALTSSTKRSDYYDYSWPTLPSQQFFNSWRNEYRGRMIWPYYDRPEPPRSPFHPEELPIGLRSSFLGFRESISEKMIFPPLRDSASPPSQKNVKNFERNVLFRHEVEGSNYKPQSFYAESPLARDRLKDIDSQHEVKSCSGEPSTKSYSFEKPFRRETGSLPLSNPTKLPYSEFFFNP